MNDTKDTQRDDRLERWVRDHAQALRGFLWAMVRDHHVADDLLQEVFCRAWEGRERYQEKGKERAFLLRIADRLAKDWRRRTGRQFSITQETWNAIEPASDDPSPLERIIRREAEQQLATALDTLTEPQRRTLLLRYYGDLGFAEIAVLMKCPLGTVLSHCRRGLLALRQLLVEEPL